MRIPENCRLIRGPYSAPRCRVGETMTCAARDRDVVVGGISDAPIQWPFARRRGPRSLIVCDELIRALWVEAAVAVAYHWGVSATTVSVWRRSLGVPRHTEGSHRLLLKIIDEARPLSWTPESRLKQSKTRKGRPRHPNFVRAAIEASRRPKSEAWKESMKRSLKEQWSPGGIRRRGGEA